MAQFSCRHHSCGSLSKQQTESDEPQVLRLRLIADFYTFHFLFRLIDYSSDLSVSLQERRNLDILLLHLALRCLQCSGGIERRPFQ